jgi:predicted AlkP superfamily pyrophosphatase or phosphodiesterase
MTRHLIYLSIPGLRPRDVADASVTPTLHAWANAGTLANVAPTFPCVTSTVQASMWTGAGPQSHGVIANGFYHRDRSEVEFWVARNNVVQGDQVWDAIARESGLTSAVWHAQNIKDAAADFIITPEPIHEPDGSTKLWCYGKPDGLYERLIADLGHFPLQHYWGPLAGIESTKWIIAAAQWLITNHDPNFHYVYIPHLDYASQKHGPNSPQATEALRELDAVLAGFADFVRSSPAGQDAVFLVASEYAMTDVSGVVYPNRTLCEAGLLALTEKPDGVTIDFSGSQAFAMVDHQVAHIYAKPDAIDQVAALFADTVGVDSVHKGSDRSVIGLDHPRSGQVVLTAKPDHWFAYYWWSNDADAPPFARTVDIHRKPGYDPVELFFDPKSRSIPLDASLVRGSHGAPVNTDDQLGALVCSQPTDLMHSSVTYRDTDMKRIVLGLLGLTG